MNIRSYRVKVYDFLYEEQGEVGDPCYCCGVESSGFDHVPPLHYVERLAEDGRRSLRLHKYPCCSECNRVLGGRLLLTKKSRLEFIQQRLEVKHQGLLAVLTWTPKEMAELGPRLKGDIQAHVALAKSIQARIDYWQ